MEYVKTFGTGDSFIKLTLFEQPMEYDLIGLLMSNLFENPMGLVQNKDAMPDEEFCPAYLGILQKNHGIVQMDKSLIDALRQGDKMAEMVMLHEVGHYVHGDYHEKCIPHSNAERGKQLRQGKVLPIELNADAFAAEYLGAEMVAAALNDLKNLFVEKFRGQGTWDESSIDDAVKELELRIEYIKNGGSHENTHLD